MNRKNIILPRKWRAPSFESSDLQKSLGFPYDIPSFDDRARRSAKNTVMPRCEDPSSFSGKRHQEIQLVSTVL